MPLPDLQSNGMLPPGIHAASLAEVTSRFGGRSAARARQARLLSQVVAAAIEYQTTKRVLIWGSFVTGKPAPADLDYSVVVSVDHDQTTIAEAHERFLLPVIAKRRYGVDAGYVLIRDFPVSVYVDRVHFVCMSRDGKPRGVVEINLRGEVVGA